MRVRAKFSVPSHFRSFHLSEMTESAITRDRGIATTTVLEHLLEVNQPYGSTTAMNANINYGEKSLLALNFLPFCGMQQCRTIVLGLKYLALMKVAPAVPLMFMMRTLVAVVYFCDRRYEEALSRAEQA